MLQKFNPPVGNLNNINLPLRCSIDATKLQTILNIIEQYGLIDGEYHKQWLIDQIVRIITGNNYRQWIEYFQGPYDEETGTYQCQWDVGIPPPS